LEKGNRWGPPPPPPPGGAPEESSHHGRCGEQGRVQLSLEFI